MAFLRTLPDCFQKQRLLISLLKASRVCYIIINILAEPAAPTRKKSTMGNLKLQKDIKLENNENLQR